MKRSSGMLAALVLVLASGVANAAGTLEQPVPVLVKTAVPLTPEVQDAIAGRAVRVTYAWPQIDALALVVSPSGLAELEHDPLVARVEPDGIGRAVPTRLPDLSADAIGAVAGAAPIETWNLDMADTAGTGYDGTGVTVAVIDSGLPANWSEFLPPDTVDLAHAAGFGAEGWGDYRSQVGTIRGRGGSTGLFPHGLAVASVILGFPSPLGRIDGAAPGATILPIRVLNQRNTGWFSWFVAAFLYVADLKASGAIPGPLVINFSIQSFGDSEILTAAIDRAIAEGVIFVTIAGNYGPANNSLTYPGRLPEAITVGAVEWVRTLASPEWFIEDVPEDDPSQVVVASFSGRDIPFRGRLDVVAPGSWVVGEWLSGNGRTGAGFAEGHARGFSGVDTFISGTSFAAPHVAGIVAQMLQKNPELTQAEVESILRGTALPLPAYPDQAAGRGLARGAAAVAATP